MSTFTSRNLIDQIISNDGYYENDPRVVYIVEYTNYWNRIVYGITWINESSIRQRRYMTHTKYTHNPKIIYSSISEVKSDNEEK